MVKGWITPPDSLSVFTYGKESIQTCSSECYGRTGTGSFRLDSLPWCFFCCRYYSVFWGGAPLSHHMVGIGSDFGKREI